MFKIVRVGIKLIIVACFMLSLKRTIAAKWNIIDVCDEMEIKSYFEIMIIMCLVQRTINFFPRWKKLRD